MNLPVEAIGIKSRWGPPHIDQMPQNPPQLVGILDDRNGFHLGSALRAHERFHLVDLGEKPGPGAFARIDVDLFIAPDGRGCCVLARAIRTSSARPAGWRTERAPV
jgi:hypothetical protein